MKIVQARLDGKNTNKIFTEQIVLCPFCLHREKLRGFLNYVRKGEYAKRGKCRECKSVMLVESLVYISNMTPKLFAKWVYDYPYPLFFAKVSESKTFDIFCDRLKRMGISYEFWEQYKELKGASFYEKEEE